MSVQKIAIDRAIAFLNAAGAQYKIVLGDFTIDTFPAPIVVPPAPTKIKRPRKHDFATAIGYTKMIADLPVGGTLTFARADYPILTENEAWHNFSSAVRTTAIRVWGADNFAWEMETFVSCTLLRVA